MYLFSHLLASDSHLTVQQPPVVARKAFPTEFATIGRLCTALAPEPIVSNGAIVGIEFLEPLHLAAYRAAQAGIVRFPDEFETMPGRQPEKCFRRHGGSVDEVGLVRPVQAEHGAAGFP